MSTTQLLRVFLLLVLSACTKVACKKPDGLLVNVQEGLLKGTELRSTKGFFVDAFLGIPFAQPPLNELRFKDPLPVLSWEDERNATEMPDHCAQYSPLSKAKGQDPIIGTEDCLYLNIFRPQNPKRRKLPVMVFIHGGAFFFGGVKDYTHKNFMDNDVVLVTLQYRLGVFGFLSTEDTEMPGNYGLKDQVMALNWVNRNIAQFNGDPDRITIFGQSTGGASVHYHILSPLSKGLFHRAIAQSGSALSPRSHGEEHRAFAGKLGKHLGCGLEADSKHYTKCMQSANAQAMLEYFGDSLIFMGAPNAMLPRVDGTFLTDHPETLLATGNYNTDVAFMTGITRDEGAIVLATNAQNVDMDHLNTLPSLLPIALYLQNMENPSEVLDKIMATYFTNIEEQKDPEAAMAIFAEMVGDRNFNVPFSMMAAHHHKHNREFYAYKLGFKTSSPDDDIISSIPPQFIPHSEELRLLFNGGGSFPLQLVMSDDIYMMRIMLDLWVSFARSGDPTSSAWSQFEWTPMTTKNYMYADLTLKPKMNELINSDKLPLWLSISSTRDHYMQPVIDNQKIEL